MGFFGWISGMEVHRRNALFIKGEQQLGPLAIKSPRIGITWFWNRINETSNRLVTEHGPNWWRRRFLGQYLGVILLFVFWLVPGLWMIGSGVLEMRSRFIEKTKILEAEQRNRQIEKRVPDQRPGTRFQGLP